MAQHTYNANFVHCIFSTKERKNTIPAELQEPLWAYLLGIANHLKMKSLAIGGTENHVHLLLGVPPTITIAEAAQKLKANSSRWMGEHGIDFQWQEGYGAFSASPSLLEIVQGLLNAVAARLSHLACHVRCPIRESGAVPTIW